MKIQNKTININFIKIIFFLAYFLIMINTAFSAVTFMKEYHKLLSIISCFLLLIIIIFQAKKYNKKSLLIILFSIIIGFLSYIFTGRFAIFITILFVIAGKNIEFDKVVKLDFYIKIFLVISIICLYFNGGTDIIRRYRDDGSIRYALGFGHPNVFGAYLFFLCISRFYLKYGKYNFVDYIFLFLCFFISYYICDSKSSYICMVLLAVCSLFFKRFEKNKLLETMIKILPIFLFITSISMVLLYKSSSSFGIQMDVLLNKRLSYSAAISDTYGISLFGIDTNINVFQELDNTYLNLFFEYGLIIFIVYMICFTIIVIKAYKEKKYNLVMCMAVIFIYGFMEKYLRDISYNVLLLYITNLLYFKNSSINLEKKLEE